ncbi:MAG: PIN domain-containing protein [bacterium]|nr:PIN domain-containing protein [bacterium]
MIAVDTNVLVYAHRPDSPFHEPALAAVTALAEGRETWAIPWPCLHEFLAVVTRPRIFDPPTPLARALGQIEAWLESPSLVLLAEGRTYWTTFRAVASPAHVSGSLVHDARIAALCRAHEVHELWTADRDFSRFEGLVVRNPTASNVVREGATPYGRRRAPRSRSGRNAPAAPRRRAR